MAAINKEVRDRLIAKIRPFKRIEPVPRMSSVYTVFNEVLLDVRYSGQLKEGHYWFFFDTYRINDWKGRQRFLECLICGDENTTLFIPDDRIFDWFDGIQPNRKGHLFLSVCPEENRLVIRPGHGKPDIIADEYLNRFDIISPAIPRPLFSSPTISLEQGSEFERSKDAIIADGGISGDSLHDRIIDMLAQLGDWSGFRAIKSYTAENSPYQIDVAWLKGDELDLAAEVHVGGNETEAKDRLRHALRLGARKVIVVTVPSAVNRLRSVCQFETELRNWLEIWSVVRVHRMYIDGRGFHREFSSFRRRNKHDQIAEYL